MVEPVDFGRADCDELLAFKFSVVRAEKARAEYIRAMRLVKSAAAVVMMGEQPDARDIYMRVVDFQLERVVNDLTG